MNRGGGRGANPWKKTTEPINNSNNLFTAEQRLIKERDKLQASAKKMETVDSSDEEELEESGQIMNKVLGNYTQHGGCNLGRTKEFLSNSFKSGAGVCLICISSIKRADPIWNCEGCFDCFHIVCIQRWSRDSLFQLKQALEDIPVFKRPSKISWACPKCRKEFDESDVPARYWCFCGKVEDPSHHPWLVPHSCGDPCDRPLVPDCGHRCLLLCHPGPCPPCPKTVKTKCHCGKMGPDAKRCSEKVWSCQRPCGKALLCNKHACPSICHPGVCPPCPQQSQQLCDCGLQRSLRPCSQPNWKCDKVCGKPFSCGHHKCELVCHGGGCGECPLSLSRKCPCGKTSAVLSCTQDIPTCNDTCGKLLDCGVHSCQLKCHKDKCACLEIVNKVCRCGLHRKEVPCGKEYTCETKCKKTKSCQKHPCNKKCCDGACGPCEKLCGRTLRCGTHKCLSVCHRGECYPCPQTAVVRCRCGESAITVPCGRERRTRPPKCKLPCKIVPDCHHPLRESHHCHFGDCPPCKQPCGRGRDACSHLCSAPCHTSVWLKVEVTKQPAGPWEVVEPKYRKQTLACAPCEEPVAVQCIGEHEIGQLPCSRSERYSCGRACGRLQNCGNHTCPLECHKDPSDCPKCELGCQRAPVEGCSHPCQRSCHSDPCKLPCKELVKVKCHCGITDLHVECYLITGGSPDAAKSCGNNCPNNYPCGHKCRSNCHVGDCPDADGCRRKVRLSCPCGRVKKELSCDVVRQGQSKVGCDNGCEAKKQQARQAKEQEKARLLEEAERKNKEELEKFEKKFQGKKKTRERRRVLEEEEKSVLAKYWLPLSLVTVLVAVAIYFIFS